MVENSRKSRNRILTMKDRIAIRTLYEEGNWTQQELADMFNVSQPRISMIINDTLGEIRYV